LLGGHINLVFSNPASAAALLKGDQIVTLAQTGEQRDPRFADVPTFKESGIKDFNANYWFALLIPVDTPASIQMKWRTALQAALSDTEVQAKFDAAGLSPYDLSPDHAQQVMLDEVKQWEQVVKDAGINTN
jgi:tripartite-type tricarboxylate transporter receptor subunit TctC